MEQVRLVSELVTTRSLAAGLRVRELLQHLIEREAADLLARREFLEPMSSPQMTTMLGFLPAVCADTEAAIATSAIAVNCARRNVCLRQCRPTWAGSITVWFIFMVE
jgi:hypothetical protein